MNLLLFEPSELAAPLPRADPRARHLIEVLRRREGDTFDAGVVSGPRGRGTLAALGGDALTLTFEWGTVPPPPDPITLLIGLPRPQTARDILRDATTLGVAALHFVTTEKSERNYASSTLWSSGEWRRHLLAGAAQAFDTRIPEVSWNRSLAEVVVALPAARLALDNYEAAVPLGRRPDPAAHAAGHGNEAAQSTSAGSSEPVVLALGPERGWGATDRALLRAQGFTLAHLGPRPLRSETAVVAALAVLKADRVARASCP